MPSEHGPFEQALQGLSGPAEAFHSVLAQASEEVRGFLSRHRGSNPDPVAAVAGELGAFGTGRIDPQRFSGLLAVPDTVSGEDLRRVERAHAILRSLESKGGRLLSLQIPRGGDLRGEVAHALAEAGKAFGVMRAIAPAVEGSGPADDPESYAAGFPFRLWSRAERALAPPLLIQLHGEDLVAAPLAEFLDGGVKIVLAVEGPVPPAPLARLVSPHVLVAQGSDPELVGRVSSFEGPVVMAIAPEGLVPFVHDPAVGSTYAERLCLNGAGSPEEEGLVRLGSQTQFQQNEDLQHLRAIASGGVAVAEHSAPGQQADGQAITEPAAPPQRAAGLMPNEAPLDSTHATDPVDRLAGWLLQQADLGSTE